MSERRDSVGTTGERPWQRQSQGGGLYDEAVLFLANCARSATARAEKQPTWMEMSVTGSSMETLYEQQISPSCLQCGAEGHWAAKCRSKEACLEGTQIMAASSGRRENRAEESGPDCEAGAELGRGQKRVGSGRMFDLRDNWKEVTASIKKRGEGASWQLTADWRKRDGVEPTAGSELAEQQVSN